MNAPTLPRLLFFTIAVLGGTGLILADRFSLVGFLLVFFASWTVMTNREREVESKKWTTPLTMPTMSQFFQAFLLLLIMLGILGYFSSSDTGISNPEPAQDAHKSVWDLDLIWRIMCTIPLLVFVTFVVGQQWMRWYRARTSNQQASL